MYTMEFRIMYCVRTHPKMGMRTYLRLPKG